MTAPHVNMTLSPHLLPAHTHSEYAADNHTHTGYAAASHAHAAGDVTSGTFAVARLPVGTAAGTVAAGNDARLSDARTPTAHTHGAADITPAPVVTASGTGAYTVNANSGTDWYLTATGNRTLTVSGGYDGQMIIVDVLASGGARTITLSGVTLTTGMVSPFSVASGKVGTIGLRRSGGIWRCLAQTVDA